MSCGDSRWHCRSPKVEQASPELRWCISIQMLSAIFAPPHTRSTWAFASMRVVALDRVRLRPGGGRNAQLGEEGLQWNLILQCRVFDGVQRADRTSRTRH